MANSVIDYTLNNPDTLTKYKTAAQISEKVLAAVAELIVPGEKIVAICEKGDKLIEEELAKVYRGKKVNKGFSHPTTVSPASFVTPYTPLTTDEAEANAEIKEGEPIKIQLGAQIDGFGSIVCDTVIAANKDKSGEEITGRSADLILANYYANELLLRLMIPPGLLASGTDEEKAKAASAKAPTQQKITSLLEKVVKSYDCNLVESTTSWLFERNEIEGKKKIVLAPAEGTKGDGVPEIGEVWGVEMGVSLGAGKIKTYDQRTTLHRRTTTNYGLKRPTSRKILSEVQKKFGTFPFSLRQLEDERDAKSGVVECVRGNVFRAYEVVGDKDNSPVARYLSTIAITKNGITKLGAPPALDLNKVKSDKKIEDEEILKILEQPLSRNTGKSKNKNKKKKKSAKKAAAGGDEEEDSDEE
ncbi:Curved dna-binding protein (42 kDa protein) [Colletotrichum higginsianum IMI 349063]|uniref:Curved dna-binding protein (42 kDa protein) n=1 Tax=Colletotrichum higginsianum (strain IMI 349063) TaxID=759273 RepID=A0A1B7YNF2_COLHI|nr:Curved dna-binding protein (42 kDa protein) [Colletotrichum higginsianum IMI 349063]OBR13587.1 Curved dna-binding protein (42 kDa protein) [Colletotrichum higginsianum IMI 349063]GJC95742.1 curved dna-binding protein 42 kDa protein [Colletotrichum higginsianum]